MRYRSKPVEIDAVQWTGDNRAEVTDFVIEHGLRTDPFIAGHVRVATVNGNTADARPGDWIIAESEPGLFYPCAADVFATRYEPVSQHEMAVRAAISEEQVVRSLIGNAE